MASSAKIDVKVDNLSGFIGMSQPSHHRLFQEKTLNQALKGFLFPVDIADRHQKLLQWIQALESGTNLDPKDLKTLSDAYSDYAHPI
jgi:hypothetical protein